MRRIWLKTDSNCSARPLRRVLAIASAGGHWVQLRRMRAAWDGCRVVYATTRDGYAPEVARSEPEARVRTVPEASRWSPLALARQALAIGWLILRHRPHVIVTTGAAPGYFAIRLGRAAGIRTIWIDSIANADEMSLSGRRAGPHADLWLTQWAHLAGRPSGPAYRGAVL